MSIPRTLAIVSALSCSLALPVLAQTAGTPQGLVPASSNPNLAVAAVKLEGGTRVGKIIGLAVYTDANEKIGSVDDVILTGDNKATVAIVSIGGILGVGSKLVAIPFDQLKRDADKAVLPGATKDSLNAMPGFIY